MRITLIPRHSLTLFQLLSCCALVACGGSGGGSKTPETSSSTALVSSISSQSSAGTSSSVAPDTTPDAFTFTAKTDADVSTEYTSDAITVKGIDIPVQVSITGGVYSINGGEFTSAAGTVSADQTITVKATSGDSTETTQTVVLTIGGISGTFTITTIDDKTPPVAEFKFPTPYTMSEANQVTVRGTATDDHAITSVKLLAGSTEVDATPKSETNGVKDFSTWTATIPLTANAENEIKVIATDDRENTIPVDAANTVVVRQRVDYSGVFPDSGSPVETTMSLLLDKTRNRLLYSKGRNTFFEIDITTAVSNTFINIGVQPPDDFGVGVIDKNAEFAYFPMLSNKSILKLNLLDPDDYSIHSNNAYGSNHTAMTINDSGEVPLLISTLGYSSEGSVITTRLDNWEAIILSDVLLEIPDSTVSFGSTRAIVFDQEHNRYLLCNSADDAVISVNASTGKREIFSNESIGSGDPYGVGEDDRVKTLGLDAPRNRLIVLELGTGNIFAVDLDTAKRSIISQMTLKHPTSNVWPHNEKNYIGAEIDTENEILYTVHHRVKALMVVDLQSGQQLILSKAAN